MGCIKNGNATIVVFSVYLLLFLAVSAAEKSGILQKDLELISEDVNMSSADTKVNENETIIELEQGLELIMEKGITKLKRLLEGSPDEPQYTSEDYMTLYTTIYKMCTQKPPHDYSQQLYDHYKQTFVDYINSTVLPSLQEKHDEFLLKELVKRWSNHKVMVRWLSRFYNYLNRYFIPLRSLPSLREVGLTYFRDMVYKEMSGNAKDAVIALITVESEGEQIDITLLESVVNLYGEIGLGEMDYYEKDLEAHMLDHIADYYSRKASSNSCPRYMLKLDDFLKEEKDRAVHYLHSSSKPKLVELHEKEKPGCRVILKDGSSSSTRKHDVP